MKKITQRVTWIQMEYKEKLGDVKESVKRPKICHIGIAEGKTIP